MLKLIQVAKLYYEENLNQSEIAKKLGVSRPLISTMLSKARSTGIVEIKIKKPFANNVMLVNQLKNVFNIQGGFVIPSSNSLYLTEKAIINQGVLYIEELVKDTKIMGIGWGYTMGKLVEALSDSNASKKSEGQICPLIGSATFPNKAYHPSELVREFGQRTGLEPSFLFAPAFPKTQQERELYTNTDNYGYVENQWKNMDTVLLSIGTYPSVPDHATALRFGSMLQEKKAVGKILSYFYDKDGQIIKGTDDYSLQVPLNHLGRAKRVVAICPPEINVKAVLGALRTGFITHIVLTEDKAKEVINNKSL